MVATAHAAAMTHPPLRTTPRESALCRGPDILTGEQDQETETREPFLNRRRMTSGRQESLTEMEFVLPFLFSVFKN